ELLEIIDVLFHLIDGFLRVLVHLVEHLLALTFLRASGGPQDHDRQNDPRHFPHDNLLFLPGYWIKIKLTAVSRPARIAEKINIFNALRRIDSDCFCAMTTQSFLLACAKPREPKKKSGKR